MAIAADRPARPSFRMTATPITMTEQTPTTHATQGTISPMSSPDSTKRLAAEPGVTLREASKSSIGRIPCAARKTWNPSTGMATTTDEARVIVAGSQCTGHTSSGLPAAFVRPHVLQASDLAESSWSHRIHLPARQRRKLRNGRSTNGIIGKVAKHVTSNQGSSQRCQRVRQSKSIHNTIDPIAATRQILGVAENAACSRGLLRSVQISETPAAKIAMDGIRNRRTAGPGNQSGRTAASHRGHPRLPSSNVHSPRT